MEENFVKKTLGLEQHFDKLSDNKNYYLNKKRNKSLISSTWDYDKILKNENEIKTTKENKRKRDLKLNNIEEKTNNTEKNNKNINLPLSNNISEELKEEEKEEKLEYEGEYLFNKKWNGKGYDKNGNVIYELINGNGLGKEYDYYGNLIYEGEYLNGQKNGKGKEYDYYGNLEYDGVIKFILAFIQMIKRTDLVYIIGKK